MLRLFPAAAFLVLIAPVIAGLAGILLPAFGFLPALGHHVFSLQPIRDLAAMPGLGRSVLLSLWTGLATTAFAFSIVVLFIAGWRGTRIFSALVRLVSPLLSVPHAAAAFGLVFLIAPSGFLFRLAAPLAGWERPPDLLIVQDRLGLAMLLGLIVKEVPFLLLMALAALPQARAAEMAHMTAALGYGRIMGFLHGVLPSLYRQIRLAVLAVLAYATAVVDVALILGPTVPAPLAVRILAWQNDADLDMHLVAASGALLQTGVTALALLIWLGAERIVAALARALAGSGRRFRRDDILRWLGAGLTALSAFIILAGIALLAIWSVAGPWRFPAALPEAFSLTTWMRVAQNLSMPLRDTLLLASASGLLAIVLAIGALEHQARSAAAGRWGYLRFFPLPGRERPSPHGARNRVRVPAQRSTFVTLTRSLRDSASPRWGEEVRAPPRIEPGLGPALQVLYIPLLVPQIAFLFGLQILFSYAGLDGTFAAVLLVHLVFVFPYVLLSLSDPWRSWDPRYGQLVRALGRGPDAIFWRVRLPMLIRPVLTAAALGSAISVGLYLPTLLIGAGRWPTITTETVALASGGDRKLIGATALLQALLPFLGFAIAAFVPAILFRNRRLLRASA